MRPLHQISTFLLLILTSLGYAQSGAIKGTITDLINNDPIPFATVVIQGTTLGASADENGKFELLNLDPGLYNVEFSSVGYAPYVLYEVEVTNSKPVFLNVELNESSIDLNEVEVTLPTNYRPEESPVSLRKIGVSEIRRFPGGNMDISKVIQSLPGVASSVSFRNDIIIRGGAPNENRFYLDGIEVPNINHFATQGSSGGPVGLLNVNFIDEVNFYSGAFPANRGNALSSVFDFRQKDGNPEKLEPTFNLGSSDMGITLDGPINPKTSYIFSARRSYLQFLFKAIGLPFLPTYNDAQFKVKTKINDNNQLTIIGLGAIDDFVLNQEVNDGITDPETLERNNYILGNLPVNTQWNYTVGANYRHFNDKGFQTIVVSRNHLNNEAFKYLNNDDSSEDNLIFNYRSQEIETKVRAEHTVRKKTIKFNVGVNYEAVKYTNSTYQELFIQGNPVTLDFDSELPLNKYGFFTQISNKFFNERLVVSLGLRSDFNDYSEDMNKPWEQLSPRASVSFLATPRLSINANTGRFYQLPAYTLLGYRDANNELANKNNGLTYIGVNHFVGGIEYNTAQNTKFSIESFYKQYDHYPFLINEGISLANLGSDFGVIGNAPATSTNNGRAYGLEVLAQQKMFKGFYGILAYTLVKSEFQNQAGKYIPSAWDNGHIINMTAGKKFKKNWELGVKWRLSGGRPYTPFDMNLSALAARWDLEKQGVFDYSRLNEERLPYSNQVDIRVDKKWFLKKMSINAYLDIQNAFASQNEDIPFINVVTGDDGNPLIDPNDPTRYQLKTIQNISGNVLPGIGLMIEF